ncbi:unnamed protein product [Triticum turgidum subsp. durum]|uniref:Gnk2-homologous domain-containing protein n=1 Tax=Triticum turgidum subsp. durum TaxID=4567 RepID=A0A9R1QW37_TRITD|nr:unnamed protein product [Triticum turgidum subsp. durum]
MALSSSRRPLLLLPLVLLLSLVAAMMALTCATSEVIVTRCCSTSEVIVTMCCPPPTPTVNGSCSLLSLVDALPSAAARTGFASLWTGGAIVRGFCFGDTAPDPCLRCLSDASRKITDQCGDASRRADFLNDGCFLGYADTSASSAGTDDDISAGNFSGDAVPRLDAADVQNLVAVAQSLCMPDRDAPECARCLRDSTLQMARSWGATTGAVQGSVAAVLGPDCYLCFEISALPPPVAEQIRE